MPVPLDLNYQYWLVQEASCNNHLM